MKAKLVAILAVAVFVLVTGCAGEQAAREAVKTVGMTATVLANKIPIQAGHMTANGRIQDPQYTIMAGMFTGGIAIVELKGVEVDGNLYGSGEGGSNTIDPEVAQIVRDCREEPQTMVEAMVRYLIRKQAEAVPTTQPSE